MLNMLKGFKFMTWWCFTFSWYELFMVSVSKSPLFFMHIVCLLVQVSCFVYYLRNDLKRMDVSFKFNFKREVDNV